jgi:xylulokinase
VVANLGRLGPIRAVAVAGHTPSLVPVGEDREETHPTLTWQDVRATKEAAELAEHFGPEQDLVGGRLPWSPAYLPAKLLWLARAGLRGTRHLLQPKDAINFCLTGVAATDIWSSKGLCRIDDGATVEALFEHAGVDPALLPRRCAPAEPLGAVDDVGAAWSGLPAGIPVGVGWSDALSGMLAVGAFTGPQAFVLTGTSDIAGASGPDRPTPDSLLHVPLSCAPLPVSYGPTQTSGSALLWLAELLNRPVSDVLAAGLEATGDVPTFLPYLAGERAPLWRPDVRASLTGVAAGCGPAELARGVLRGVALSNRHVLEEAGLADEPVHIGGSSGQAPAWVRARLECLGADLAVHHEPDTSALGAAMLAAVAAGAGPVARVSARMAGAVTLHHPGADDRAAAHQRFARYRRDVATVLAG